jgi:Bacteriophage HK97-gp10, putative tail-component
MPVTLTLDAAGILRRQLEAMPRILEEDGAIIVRKTAETASGRIRAQYERVRKTGTLASRVSVRAVGAGRGKVIQDVASRAPHAWLYENDSKKLRRTRKGASRGVMTGADVFIPEMIRYRRLMYQDIKAMIARYGLQVSGDA